jgi:hypothetical protein
MVFVRGWTWFVITGLACLGWAAGAAVVARPARACECLPPTWTVRFESAAVAPAGDDHARHWPAQGTLTSYPGTAYIWSDRPVETGVIGRVGASSP